MFVILEVFWLQPVLIGCCKDIMNINMYDLWLWLAQICIVAAIIARTEYMVRNIAATNFCNGWVAAIIARNRKKDIITISFC